MAHAVLLILEEPDNIPGTRSNLTDTTAVINPPEGAYKAAGQRKRGDITRFAEGPVVGGEGPRQRTLPQGYDKVDTPEESNGVVDLQVEEVSLEQTFFVVIYEDAAGCGAV